MGFYGCRVIEAIPISPVFSVGMLELIAPWLHTDNEWLRVFLVVVFYQFRARSPLVAMITSPFMSEYGRLGFMMALNLLVTYNEERGIIKGEYAKYGDCAYYPIHIFFIYAILL